MTQEDYGAEALPLANGKLFQGLRATVLGAARFVSHVGVNARDNMGNYEADLSTHVTTVSGAGQTIGAPDDVDLADDEADGTLSQRAKRSLFWLNSYWGWMTDLQGTMGNLSSDTLTADTGGPIISHLRGLIKWAYERTPASLGTKAAAASWAVTLSTEDLAKLEEMRVLLAAPTPAGTNNIGDVDLASSLPAGTNNIGDVDIASALPAGTNNIGDVDVASSALPTGAATSALQETNTTAIGLLTPSRAATSTIAVVTASAAVVTLRAAAATRLGLKAVNDSDRDMYVKEGAAASLTDYTERVPAGLTWKLDGPPFYTGIVTAIWESGVTGSARVTELTP